jgi:hypothetical protein
MVRHEPNIRAAVRTELEVDELFSIDRDTRDPAERERQEAIACCLSASEGWDEAIRRLGGAFAARADAAGTDLRERKAD